MRIQVLKAIHRLLQKIFKDRDVIVRSEGHVRYYTISRRSQMWLLAPFALFFLWLAGASIGFVYQQDELERADIKMQLFQHEYLDLMTQFAHFQHLSKGSKETQRIAENLKNSEKEMSFLLLKEALIQKISNFNAMPELGVSVSRGMAVKLDQISKILDLDEAEYKALHGYKTILSRKLDVLDTDLKGATFETARISAELKQTELFLKKSHQKTEDLTNTIAALNQQKKADDLLLKQGNDKALALAADIKKMQLSLADLKDQKAAVIKQKQALGQQMAQLSEQYDNSQSHAAIVEQQLEIVESALHNTLRERGELTSVNRQLEQELVQKQDQVAAILDFQNNVTENATKRTEDTLNLISETVKMTGIPVNKLLARVSDEKKGMGGPFVSVLSDLDISDQYEESLQNLEARLDKLNDYEKLVRLLPIHEPVQNYRVTSRFGRRKDPINNKWATHKGLDMAGKKNTPIYAPSSGIVIFAGTLGGYGRFIEIDHGKGIKTRYGHLNKIFVRKGQKVAFRKKIGLMGNTGRNTGTHLHYEIMLDGKQVNPEPFIKAGRYVFKK